ncbi:MAG TPA: alkene reductase [Stellaceae bacterium]
MTAASNGTGVTLFSPLKFGRIDLPNRIVMSPMTRSRADENFAPPPMSITYYAQRASAGLVIAESTTPSPNAHCYVRQPGIYTKDQIAAWRKVTDAVHEAGGRIFLQLNHGGRAGHPLNQPQGAEIVAPSAIAMKGTRWTDQHGETPATMPRTMMLADIEQVIAEFGQAARNAVEAGMDGIELHCSTGYLMEQFLNPSTNHRTDSYGGTMVNRARFVVNLLTSVSDAIGPDRVGIRVSPYSFINDLVGDYPEMEDTYRHLVAEMNRIGILYQHLKDVSSSGGAVFKKPLREEMRRSFKNFTMQNGGFDKASAEAALATGEGDLIVFGRSFIGNPDLVARFKNDWPITAHDDKTVYTPGAKGYIDYPTYGA